MAILIVMGTHSADQDTDETGGPAEPSSAGPGHALARLARFLGDAVLQTACMALATAIAGGVLMAAGLVVAEGWAASPVATSVVVGGAAVVVGLGVRQVVARSREPEADKRPRTFLWAVGVFFLMCVSLGSWVIIFG